MQEQHQVYVHRHQVLVALHHRYHVPHHRQCALVLTQHHVQQAHQHLAQSHVVQQALVATMGLVPHRRLQTQLE